MKSNLNALGFVADYGRDGWTVGTPAFSGDYFTPGSPFEGWGVEFNGAIIVGMCFMAVISAIETVGDVSGITMGGAGREATDREIQGATYADGIGTAISAGLSIAMATW